jgi:hypothetical protein
MHFVYFVPIALFISALGLSIYSDFAPRRDADVYRGAAFVFTCIGWFFLILIVFSKYLL